MNVNKVLTKDYENETLSRSGKNKANSKPNKANSKPIKANIKPKQTQYKAKQTQFQSRKMLPRFENDNRRKWRWQNITASFYLLNIIEFRGELTESQNKLWCQQSGQNGRSGAYGRRPLNGHINTDNVVCAELLLEEFSK